MRRTYLLTLVVLLASCRLHSQEESRVRESIVRNTQKFPHKKHASVLYFKYRISDLSMQIESQQDTETKLTLWVDVGRKVVFPKVVSSIAFSSGFFRSIEFDLKKGSLARKETFSGNEISEMFLPPSIGAIADAHYNEALEQLIKQVSLVRDGRSLNTPERPALQNLVEYLESVRKQIVSASVEVSKTSSTQSKM